MNNSIHPGMRNSIHPAQDNDKSLSNSDEEDQDNQEIDVFHNYEKAKFPFIEKFLNNLAFQILISLLTFYTLFSNDIRMLAFRKDADYTFDALTIMCMCVFGVEILLASIAKQGYLFSFFFWLDIISTVSMILDLTMFNEAVGLVAENSAKTQSQVTSAGKGQKQGTKAAQIVRLVRLIRIVKLYKAIYDHRENQLQLKKRLSIHPTQDMDDNNTSNKVKESRVSKRLSDQTTKKVIILVIVLLLVMPVFDASYWYDSAMSLDYATRFLANFSSLSTTSYDDIKMAYNYVIQQHAVLQTPVAYLNTPFTPSNLVDYVIPGYDNMRESEKTYYYTIVNDQTSGIYQYSNLMLAVSDNTQLTKLTAMIDIINILFVSCVLLFGAIAFARDAQKLALEPIERMIMKVNLIAKNPLIAKELKLESANQQQEMTQIENAIIKIGALLALGFGDAGCEIITLNMAKNGDLDPMLPGKRKWAVYGFCDIRNFTDATEVLQKDVMIFVNNIAEIVHSMVDRYKGSANKNIGDAFLLVWKINEQQYVEEEGVAVWNDIKYINNIADSALISFMKIFAKINREQQILAYREDTRLNQRLPNYKVKMGFGLHIGWGIEGAIGSEFKIDASYLSPNVNMASRLEAATKQYGVALLISGELQQYFSPSIQKYVRQIDVVTVKGSVKPVSLYTVEMDDHDLPPSKYDLLTREQKPIVMYEKKQNYEQMVDQEDYDIEEYFKCNKDLVLLLRHFDPDFYHIFNQGFQGYLLGNWKEAQMYFERAKAIRPNDGPIATLQSVLAEHNMKAPNDWKGYRELTEK